VRPHDAPVTTSPSGGGRDADGPGAEPRLLVLERVGVRFGATVVLEAIDLAVGEGEFVAVVGPSGSGKTTLLRVIDGLIPCSAGSVRLRGQVVRRPGRDRGFVFQSDCLLPWRTVLDNVAFSLQVQGTKRGPARETARRFLALTGLAGCGHLYPGELSGGMRQRVNLARALAIDPEILLMDEPFAALDAQTREVMQLELLDIWQRRRKTALFVTHQLDEAVYLADRVVVLTANPGRIRAVVPVGFPRPRPLELKHTPEFGAQVDELWRLIREEVMRERRV
jgi:NitT/TauT family transport system ATP-binding protein